MFCGCRRLHGFLECFSRPWAPEHAESLLTAAQRSWPEDADAFFFWWFINLDDFSHTGWISWKRSYFTMWREKNLLKWAYFLILYIYLLIELYLYLFYLLILSFLFIFIYTFLHIHYLFICIFFVFIFYTFMYLFILYNYLL